MRPSLRPIIVADIPALDPILMAAYENPSTFAPRLSRYLALGPGNWIVAELDGRPAGMGGINVLGKTAYVGMVVTDPPLQGRGVATAVMGRLLELARERGCERLLLDASPAGKPLYEKLGFVADDLVGHWKRPAPTESTPAAQAVAAPSRVVAVGALTRANASRQEPAPRTEPATRQNVATSCDFAPRLYLSLAALDRAAFGDDRARFVAAYVMDDPRLAAYVPGGAVPRKGEGGGPEGYLVLQAESGNLGPWVALDAKTGSALLDWALGLEEARRELSVYMPGGNPEGRRALEAAGFSESRVLTHMRLGPTLPSERRRLVWGQANLSLG